MRRRAVAAIAAGVLANGCAFDVADDGGAQDWRDEVIYEIVVDRFDDGDVDNDWIGEVGPVPGDLARHQGGDWAGVRRRLDYIEGLGVTTLWISPIVRNVDRNDYQDGYHGYWAADFTELNPRFGDVGELQGLVADAHARGMKVIVDVVTNHAGRVFFYDFDGDGVADDGEVEPGFSPQPIDAPLAWITAPPRVFLAGEVVELGPEQFHRRGETTDPFDANEKELGDFPTGLRDLDTERPEVVEAMIDTYAHWIEVTDIDGFRLDAIPHVPHAFWRQFAGGLRARLADIASPAGSGKPRFLLVGEVFDPDAELLASYTRDGGLDSVFDFSLLVDVINGVILDGDPAADAVPALAANRALYPDAPHPGGVGLTPWQARVAFADNHDVPRLRYWLDDAYAAELAMTVVFTVDAIPSVYYGTEQELNGGWGNASREVMWETGFRTDTRMARHLRRLAAIRRDSLALRRGDLTVRYASEISARESGPGAGLLAWERAAGDDRVLVAINGHPVDDAEADVPTGFPEGIELVDQLGGSRTRVGVGGVVHLRLAPRSAVVLR